MYGATRFLANNLLTAASQMTPSSQYPGVITGAIKVGSGSAALTTSGTFTDSDTLIYQIVIDSVAGGKSVGQSTYKWRESSMAAGVWGATGVTTHATAATLNNGVDIAFVAGAGDDFEVNDTFTFRALPTYGVGNLLQFQDRGSFFRSKNPSTAVNIVCDFGTPQTVTAFALCDHNLTDAASITLEANTTNTWTSPAYTKSITYAELIVEYLSETYRYWRLVISDSGNATGFLEAGLLYLGTYVELSRNAEWGAEGSLTFNIEESRSAFGIRRGLVHSKQEKITLSFPLISSADVSALRTMAETLNDVATGKQYPLILHLFHDEADKVYIVYLLDGIPRTFRFVGWHEVNLTFEEVVKPRV